MKDWLRVAMRRDIVLRGLKVAAMIGTILVAINQGDVILAGELPISVLWKVALTYLVPYCVSTYAAVEATLKLQNSRSGH